jgi:polysaccharide biosynthesis protein PslH
MRILYILPFVPWSIRVRSYNLIPRLARRHIIDLVCLASSEEDAARLEEMRSFCGSATCVLHNKRNAIANALKALISPVPLRMAYASCEAMKKSVHQVLEANPPDVIYVERWRGLQYIPSGCEVPILCDPTDSMILYNRRLMSRGSWWERILGTEEYLKFFWYEPALAQKAHSTVFCSSLDRDCVLRRKPDLNCEIVPNGVDCKRLFRKHDGDAEPRTIIFTGNFNYRPNLHAVRYFLDKIFPAVQRECPEARFLAVGNAARVKLKMYANKAPAIRLVDFVTDLRPYLTKATLAVAPITLGVGVSNKVLEAFSVGTPVVATAFACGDLPVQDGKHLYIANGPRVFAERVLDLIHDCALRAQMAQQARILVEREYDWDVVTGKLESLMGRLVSSYTALTMRGLQHIAAI